MSRSFLLAMLLSITSAAVPVVAQNNALYFNNTPQSNGQYARLEAAGASILKPVRLTVEMWAKAPWSTMNGTGWVSLISNTYNSGYDIYYDGTSIVFEAYASGSYRAASYAITNLAPNEWYHLAGTWDGMTSCLYVNGALVASSAALGAPANLAYSALTATLLGDEAANSGGAPEPGYYFTGYVDDVRIWNLVRTQAEIQASMYTEAAGTESGLVGYYMLNAGSGTSLANGVSGSPEGVLSTAAAWTASTAPINNATQAGYLTSRQSLWGAMGTTIASASSNGLTTTASSTLGNGVYVHYANNGVTGSEAADLPGELTKRLSKIWHFDVTGGVTANLNIDAVTAEGSSFPVGDAAEYSLLYRSGTSGVFTSVAAGSSVNGNVITFNGVVLADGYYTVGVTANASMPVELVSFTAAARAGTGIVLSWTTATETKNAGFEIERRTNGELSSIGYVPGAGSSNVGHSYAFTDSRVQGQAVYRLKQIDVDGASTYSAEVEVHAPLPTEFALGQNYPNPFNPSTTIEYLVPVTGHVTMNVYDMLGRGAATLVNEMKEPGTYTVHFNAASLSSGLYVYTMHAGGFTASRKLFLMK